MTTAIILAAGNGTRLESNIPKQFIKIGDRRILDYSVKTFLECILIDEVILVVHPQWVDNISIENPKIKIVVGGITRKDSVSIGLKNCSIKTKNVLIHDSARPFLSKIILENCIFALDKAKAITTAVPVIDTIVEAKDNQVISMLERPKLWAEQTPQGFHYQLIKKAHDEFQGDTTDDIRMVMKLGIIPKIIKGSEYNFKITTDIDLLNAKIISQQF